MHFLFSAILSGGGSPIDLDGTLFIQLGVFAIAFLLMRSLVFKPVMALFDAREAAIDGAREEARRLTEEASEKGDTFEEEIRRVKIKAGEERDRLRHEGARLDRTIQEKVRTETAATLRDAEVRMKQEGDRVRREIKVKVPALAREIAAKLLGREISS